MPQPAANPEPPPAAALDDDERRARERQEAIDAYNARRAKEGLPPLEPERAARFVALDEEIAARAAAIRRHDEQKRAQQEAAAPRPAPKARSAIEIIEDAKKAQRERQKREAQAPEDPKPAAPRSSGSGRTAAKQDKISNFPVIPDAAAAVVNEIASSAMFAAIQGKDRKILNDEPIAATGDTLMYFSGEQLNQDDHDVFMVLVCLASTKPAGEYINVSAHCLLKALGRDTGGKQHKQLDGEIKRLTKATVEIKSNRYTYIGHLVHDAIKDEKTKNWIYRLNENLIPLYGASCYTLINWEQRKRLKGKDLARWLQLEIARHAVPFPVKVETLRERCGSQAKELRDFRRSLKQALAVLQAEGHIAAWHIDENDLLHVDRGAALTASQRRSLAPPSKR